MISDNLKVTSKRGMSGIVVTLITVLLAIVAIGIVWFVISNILEKGVSGIDYSSKCINSRLEITSITELEGEPGNYMVGLKRLPTTQGVVLEGIVAVFANESGNLSRGRWRGNVLSSKSILFTEQVHNVTKVNVQVYFYDEENPVLKHYCEQTYAYDLISKTKSQASSSGRIDEAIGGDSGVDDESLSGGVGGGGGGDSVGGDGGEGNPVCGNGVLETGEECDDGNTADDDNCMNDCKLPESVGGQGDDTADTVQFGEWAMFGKSSNRTRYTNEEGPSDLSNPVIKTFDFEDNRDLYSSPAVSNGFVYVGSYKGKVYQLNANDVSQEIASFDTGGQVQSSPAVANGFVYVGSDDGNFYQLNASDVSQEIARFEVGNPIDSSPVVEGGYVYTGELGEKFYQLNASDVSQEIARFSVSEDQEIHSSPAVANGFVYLSGTDKKLYQLNASNVSQKISEFIIDSSPISFPSLSSPAVSKEFVYIGSPKGEVYQLNASDVSQEIASFDEGSSKIDSSPALANGFVYIIARDKKAYQLNASDVSQEIAEYDTFVINQVTSPAVTKDYLYFATGGKITQLDSTNISKQIGRTRDTRGFVYSTPAISDGSLYVVIRDSGTNPDIKTRLYQFS